MYYLVMAYSKTGVSYVDNDLVFMSPAEALIQFSKLVLTGWAIVHLLQGTTIISVYDKKGIESYEQESN
jgi:hypothetical protein